MTGMYATHPIESKPSCQINEIGLRKVYIWEVVQSKHQRKHQESCLAKTWTLC